MDKLSPEHRSWNMGQIKGKDTKPEIFVRSILHRMGLRFRLHRNDLPGKPDIVLPKHETVIFVHGCFWHRHPRCKFAYKPKSKQEFWMTKFNDNVRRDRDNATRLKKLGWCVVVIWECELRDPEKLQKRLINLFDIRD